MTFRDLAVVRLRYRPAETAEFVEVEHAVAAKELNQTSAEMSRELRLAAIVAEFAEILKRSYWARQGSLQDLLARAQTVSAEFSGDADVAELAALVGRAARLEAAER